MLRAVVILWMALWAHVAGAADLSALARPDPESPGIRDLGRGGVGLELDLSQPVPYRLRLLKAPARVVVDFNEVDWRGFDAQAMVRGARVSRVAAGVLRPGWSRLELYLAEPMQVSQASMRRDRESGRARLDLRLVPVPRAAFDAMALSAAQALHDLPEPADIAAARPRQDGVRPLRVVLDPGHGGVDPGAEQPGLTEAGLMLTFARELRDMLRRAGMEVTMTRDADVFVPLEMRITLARAARADVFLSLHADSLPEGYAHGATVYTLSRDASEMAGALLAERHNRTDLLAGVDLSAHGDDVAAVLMDLARRETAPRNRLLAEALVTGLRAEIGTMHKRPHQQAGFSVLKAPDYAAALIELGFMSSPRDLEKLVDPVWREQAARGIVRALQAWAREDAAQRGLLRQ